jgi:hypothetical protein
MKDLVGPDDAKILAEIHCLSLVTYTQATTFCHILKLQIL